MEIINIGMMPVCPDCGKVMLFGEFDHKVPTIDVHCENSKCVNSNIMYRMTIPTIHADIALAN
jgi:uncharacterized protein (DUF983 family)